MASLVLGRGTEEMNYGELIQQRRELRGVKSTHLSVRMGRNPGYVSRIETGAAKEVPPPDVMAALERELGVSVLEQLEALGYPVRAVESQDLDANDPVRRLLPALRAIEWNADRLKLFNDMLRSMQQIDAARAAEVDPIVLNSR